MAATVREGFLCAGITENKLHYSCTASFQKMIYGKPPPTGQSIYDWSKKFQGTGCLCIPTAVASVDEDMLRSVWTELDYRIDICRVTKRSHIEQL